MIEAFRKLFGPAENIRVFRAPGRVNLIGEHTDYNLGFVLPVALSLATYVAAAPSGDGKLRIYSEDRKQLREWDAAALDRLAPARDWTDYPIGVARQLMGAGIPIEPVNLLIRSTVPPGSGLSSSAALEVSCALALLNGRAMAPLDLAQLCQRAEREFGGLPCGIMDQYISVFGKEHSAIEIDCRSLDHQLVPLPDGIAFIAVNTMVKHALADSAYQDRVAECAAAVAGIRQKFPSVESLRDVSPQQLDSAAHLLPGAIARRARHVVTENARVRWFVRAGGPNKVAFRGGLMAESHRSLRDDYEVSCEELDFLVESAQSIEGVYGSRMTGGGFGGCTVTMLRSSAAERFRQEIAEAYRRRFQAEAGIYTCEPSAGAAEVNNFSAEVKNS